MECRTVQILMPYVARPAELGPEDTAELSAHLAACPRCGALARAESSFDAAIGRAMNAVPVPADLLGQIHAKLGRERRASWRKPLLRLSAAAAALLMICLGVVWWNTHKIEIYPESVARNFDEEYTTAEGLDAGQVENFFRKKGLRIQIPGDFDMTALVRYDVVSFDGHDVARLDFLRGELRANMFILPKSHFRLQKDWPEQVTSSRCTVDVIDLSADCFVLVVYHGDAKPQHFKRNAIFG